MRKSPEEYSTYRDEIHRVAQTKCQRKARRDPSRWPKYKLYGLKKWASYNGVPFDITPADIQMPEVCPVFKTPFVYGEINHPQGPSVDRLKPELGYVRGNVRVISFRANTIKRDAILEELEALVAYMKA